MTAGERARGRAYKRANQHRQFVFLRDDGRCVHCDGWVVFLASLDPDQIVELTEHRVKFWSRDVLECMGRASLDHVRDVAKGGSNDPSNLVLACLHCNQKRGRRRPVKQSRP